jgi:hypothetical protein
MFVPCIYIHCPAATLILEGLDLLSEESYVMPAILLNLGFYFVIGQTVEFVSVAVCFPNATDVALKSVVTSRRLRK